MEDGRSWDDWWERDAATSEDVGGSWVGKRKKDGGGCGGDVGLVLWGGWDELDLDTEKGKGRGYVVGLGLGFGDERKKGRGWGLVGR